MGFEWPTDMVTGAAGGTIRRTIEQHGTPVLGLLQEEEVRTPPKRELHSDGTANSRMNFGYL